MLKIIISYFLVILQNYAIIKFLNILFNKIKLNIYDIILIVILSIETLVTTSTLSPLLAAILPIVTCVIYIYIRVDKHFCRVVFSVIICFSILYFINLFTICLLSLFGINYFKISFYQSCIVTSIAITTFLIIVSTFSHIKHYGSNFKLKTWIALTTIPILSIIIINIVYYLSFTIISPLPLLSIMILILAINVVLFRLFISLSKDKDRVKQSEITKTAVSYQNIILKDIKETYEKTLKLQHDFNNHIAIIKALITNDNSDNYIKKLELTLPNITTINSDNTILNYIINQKLIDFNGQFYFSCFGGLSYIDDFDIVTIFGNLLDNALEAQESLVKKYISININDSTDIIRIEVKNKYDSCKLNYQDNHFISSKSNQKTHGLGLNNIQEAIEKYNGVITIYYDDVIFKVTCQIHKNNIKIKEGL